MSILVTGTLEPMGLFGILHDVTIKGGYRVIDSTEDLNSIPDDFRKPGMMIFIKSTKKQLLFHNIEGDLTDPSKFTELTFSSSQLFNYVSNILNSTHYGTQDVLLSISERPIDRFSGSYVISNVCEYTPTPRNNTNQIEENYQEFDIDTQCIISECFLDFTLQDSTSGNSIYNTSGDLYETISSISSKLNDNFQISQSSGISFFISNTEQDITSSTNAVTRSISVLFDMQESQSGHKITSENSQFSELANIELETNEFQILEMDATNADGWIN